MNLRIPGPTPCPDAVLRALGQQMINHRSREFEKLLYSVTDRMRACFQTQGDLFIFSGSGTGGLECAVVNFLSPGERVLFLSNGAFGERFADIAAAYGAEVQRLRFEWGTAVEPQAVRDALEGDPAITAVYVTHNETSTGVTNDLAAISAVVQEFGKLLLVDAISSIGSIPLPVDEWRCDVVVSGSQKGWMIPPGLTMVSINPRAWEAHSRAKMPRYFWDISLAKRYLERGETPFTPAVSLYYALDAGLRLLEEEGLRAVHARHARVGQRAREGIKSLGLALLPAEERYASNTVTAVKVPEGTDVGKLLTLLQDEHGVVLASGQGKLSGKIFRIGHLGLVSERDIDDVTEALRQTLPRVGVAVPVPTRARGA